MKFQKLVTVGIGDFELDAEYWKRIDSLAGKSYHLSKDDSTIKKQLADADCLLVNPFKIKVDKELLSSAPKLKYVGGLGTSYGSIDVDYAKAKGITVCNIPGYSTEAVAEFVFATVLSHIRELEKARSQVKAKNYSEAGYTPIEIKDKIFGIFGLGRIGSRVAELALGFGADVRYWSRNRKKDIEAKGVKYEDRETLIPKCDFLSLHFAQTKDTEKFLNEERINKIKSGAIVINTAPMELVDTDALENRLKKNDIIFILDHADEMPEEDLKRLSKYANCIVYPPIAYVTKEARIAKQEIFVNNIASFLNGKPTNAVS